MAEEEADAAAAKIIQDAEVERLAKEEGKEAEEAEAEGEEEEEEGQVWDKDSMSWVPAPQSNEEGETESVMDEGEEMSELGSVGGSSVGSLGLSGLSAGAPNGPADAEFTTPAPTRLSYPKPPGRVPKGKVWDGATGHWAEAEAKEAEEGGDAKRAKTE